MQNERMDEKSNIERKADPNNFIFQAKERSKRTDTR